MEFRRNATRDDRRRRAILDDRNAAGRDADASGEDATNGKRARRYSSQALLERRVRIVDLIPLHWSSVGAYYLLGVVLIGLLAALHYYASAKASFADLTTVNSLGGWLAVVAFWTATQTALVIYRIRRHRLDDYRGRYHVWLWAVAVLGIAGIDLLVDFRNPLGQLIEQASGRQFAELEHGWALLVATTFYGLAFARIVWEIRASRGAMAVALLSIATLGTFVAAQANLILWPQQIDAALSTCVLYLSGMWLMSMMLMQYARFVWMDAIGMIAVRAVAETTEAVEKAPAKTARRRPTIVKKEGAEEQETAAEADSESGWFSWGAKKSKPASEEETEKTPAPKRTAKPAAKTAAKESEEEAPAEKKRGWFGFGGKRQAEAETPTQGVKEVAKPATPKPSVAKKVVETNEAESPKRGWFGFGAKKEAADDVAAEKQKPVKPVAKSTPKPAEKAPVKEEPAADEKKRGWFGFGGKAKSEAEQPVEKKQAASPLASSARRAMLKQQQAETAAPAETLKMEPLTLGGGSDDNSNDDEIAMLEAKPDHLLSKAERRRLKKLKRRGVAA
ncbi:hypothetical protein [Blastopirellula marina]|uniref:Uncharacterized protein n=1 Tax=Blastopirellula marina DSM 3645 TaxID=314230 RepID=A4A1V2_9BACT|nr:hypothetical protein [Blastopirellula marina]EAQ77242.1 hypothetical protein DSM3645_13370 [Blastopirellula marina DSM 3645]